MDILIHVLHCSMHNYTNTALAVAAAEPIEGCMDPLLRCVNYSCALALPTKAEWPASDLVDSISIKQCDCH